MPKNEFALEVNRTYDTAVILQAARDTVCPNWMKKSLDELLNKCFDFIPKNYSIRLVQEESPFLPYEII